MFYCCVSTCTEQFSTGGESLPFQFFNLIFIGISTIGNYSIDVPKWKCQSNIGHGKAGTIFGASSQAGFLQNYFIIVCMLRFLQHLRQKWHILTVCNKSDIFRHFFWQKVTIFYVLQQKKRNKRWSSFSLSISSISLHFVAARLPGCRRLWQPGPG